MKSILQGKIVSTKNEQGTVTLEIVAKGKVETLAINAKEVTMSSVMTLKSLITDNMKIGAVLYITVSDENPVE